MWDFSQEIFSGSFGLKEQAENSNIPKGAIAAAADFPTLAEVKNGWTYTATANVTDNDPTKTNTGQLFIAGQEFYWFDDAWVILGDDRIWSDDGTSISPVDARNVDIPAGKTYRINGSPHTHSHNDSTSKQGGTTDEYYHLTQSENARVAAAAGYMQVKVATTTNITLSGEQTIDGESCVAGDLVLVKDQTLSQNNGVYVVVAGGAWTRATFADTDDKLLSAKILATRGVLHGGQTFKCLRQYPFSLGTDSITFFNTDDNTQVTSQSFYISTTGSDLTGDGSAANPYYSIQRCLKDMKPQRNVHNTYIYCAAGTYDMSTQGPIHIQCRTLGTGQLFIMPADASIANWYTQLDAGGSFDTNTDCVHTDTDKSWSTDQWVGKFVRISSVKSGSLPTEGTETTYRNIPIIRNGANWVECAYTFNNNENWNAYTIVEPAVKITIDNNTLSFIGSVVIRSIAFTKTTGGYISDESGAYSASPSIISFTNSSIISTSTTAGGTRLTSATFTSCAISCARDFPISSLDYSAFHCSYSSATSIKAGYLRKMKNSIARDSGANKGYFTAVSTINESRRPYILFSGKNKFIGFLQVVQLNGALKNGDVCFEVANTTYCGLEFDSVNYFINCKSKNLVVSSDYPITFGSEPSIARLTFSGSAAATEYFNARYGLNALAIAPAAYNFVTHDTFENTDVDTGTEVVDSFADTACKAVRWDFMVSNSGGTAVRCGSINAVWDAAADTINDSDEYGVVEVGDTADLTFTVTIAANLVTLSAVAASNNWTVKVQRYPIG